MTKLEMYDLVNKCDTAEALSDAILLIADDGVIQGRTRGFNAEKMAASVPRVISGELEPNILTREFGIRQQALYLQYYE